MCLLVIVARFYMPAINKRTACPRKAEPAFCLGCSSAKAHISIPAAAFELQPGVLLCAFVSVGFMFSGFLIFFYFIILVFDFVCVVRGVG